MDYIPAFAVNVLRLCLWLALLAAVFVPLERLFALHPQQPWRPGMLTDLGYYFLSSLIPSLVLSAPIAVFAALAQRIVPPAFADAVAQAPLWARLAAAFLIGEIGFYWGHRLTHEIPLLWRFHAVHHSAERMDWLVNTRAHPVDMIFTRLCGLLPLTLVGLAAPVAGPLTTFPLLVLLVGTVWGFFVHANLHWRFGALEWLISTPAFHHWHHTRGGGPATDKNYAAMLPLIDRVFGTLYLPKHGSNTSRPERYGIDQAMPADLPGQLLQPLRGGQFTPPPASRRV